MTCQSAEVIGSPNTLCYAVHERGEGGMEATPRCRHAHQGMKGTEKDPGPGVWVSRTNDCRQAVAAMVDTPNTASPPQWPLP